MSGQLSITEKGQADRRQIYMYAYWVACYEKISCKWSKITLSKILINFLYVWLCVVTNEKKNIFWANKIKVSVCVLPMRNQVYNLGHQEFTKVSDQWEIIFEISANNIGVFRPIREQVKNLYALIRAFESKWPIRDI